MVTGADLEVNAVENEAGCRASRSWQLPEIDRQPETARLTCLANIFGYDVCVHVFRRVLLAPVPGFAGKSAPVVPMLNHSRW